MSTLVKIRLQEMAFGLTLLLLILGLAWWSSTPTKSIQSVAQSIDVMTPVVMPPPKKTDFQDGMKFGAEEALQRILLVNLEARMRETNWNMGQMQEIVLKRMFGTNACWPFECSP